MSARMSFIIVLAGFVLHLPAGFSHRVLGDEKLADSTTFDKQSNENVAPQQPSITVQDQSSRLSSEDYRVVVVPAGATGKQRPELHLDEDRVFEDRPVFRSNEPPLLLKTAAYGLSQAVKLADHKISEPSLPLLIDGGTSRQVSHDAPADHLSACKYCRHNHPQHSKDKLQRSSSELSPARLASSDGNPVEAPKESKTVKELVDLMESLGPGVLENSVFNSPSASVAGTEPNLRQELAQNLQVLEASDSVQDNGISTDPDAGNPWYDVESGGLSLVEANTDPEGTKNISVRIDALRNSAEQLDLVANQLERRDLYYQSDQLRELAAQLRADARNARIALMAQPGVEAELPEVESSEVPLDMGPVTRGALHRVESQLDQLLQAARSERGETAR